MFCNNCGHRNPSQSNFCSSCGTPLEHGENSETTITLSPIEGVDANEEELTVSIPETETGVGVLVVKRGPNAGSRFQLDPEVTKVGRHPDSDIFLDDVTVSRRHAEVTRRDSGYWVMDVGSLNGTYLNRERVDFAKLSTGDEVQIGRFKLVFLSGAIG
ncbi:MAG TPA: FHA domain-containing protein [Acidimicrobiales bacterium]|nr:FHA domain-containing protein [Acidimicrobiales bacterium]